MSDRMLTGSRLRNRRIDRGLKQAELARAVGISGSYLNLIEHNRRRIGANLLQALARALETDAQMFEDDTAASVLAPLYEAAAAFPKAGAEESRAEDLIGRFPGWGAVIAAQQAQISRLSERVEALSNRLAHDTQIATSLHEVISTATAIRSTASILVESPDLDRDWQARFHSNINEEAARLSQSSQALLGLLDVENQAHAKEEMPAVERAEAAMSDLGFHLPAIEAGEPLELGTMNDAAVLAIVESWLNIYAQDAARLPLSIFAPAAAQLSYDPAALAERFAAPFDLVLRRLAQLPDADSPLNMGLVRCDGAGVILFQKPVLDFRLPRASAACPLWPLYQSFAQFGRPLRAVVQMPGGARTPYECFAIANLVGPATFEGPGRVEATMLVRPARREITQKLRVVGPGCRVCPVQDCDARRQPSVIA